MHRSTVIAAVIAASLATEVAPAAAKEAVSATVCGASDCREVTDQSMLQPILEGGPPTDPPRRAAGWYRATLTLHGEGGTSRFSNVVVPAAGMVRNEEGTWMPMTPAGARAYAKITSGLVARPASTLRGLPAAAPSHASPTPDDSTFPWVLAAALGASGLALTGLGRVCRQRTRFQHRGVVAGEDDGAGVA